jgi:hypothetical protein
MDDKVVKKNGVITLNCVDDKLMALTDEQVEWLIATKNATYNKDRKLITEKGIDEIMKKLNSRIKTHEFN